MCLELMYENSTSRGLVDFSYLAIDDKMIVDKSHISPKDYDSEYVETHGGFFNAYLLFKLDDSDNKTILTALLNYDDLVEWEGSLQQILTNLSNDGLIEALNENIMTMFIDAMHNAGFCGTYVGDLIESALMKGHCWFCRTTDFQMHEASSDDLHPGFDT